MTDDLIPDYAPEGGFPVPDDEPGTGFGKKKSQATTLIEIAEQLELFHDPDLVPYATLDIDGHREVWPLRSGAIRTWLARAFYVQEGKGCGSQALSDALAALEGKACFDAPEHCVHSRIAEHDGAVYIDLCDQEWAAVHVTSNGWEIVTEPPVMFRRAKAMRPLPRATRGGSIEALRPFLNLDRDEDWVLAVAWLVAAYGPRGPYTCLGLYGPQGSAKTSTGRRLRSLVDPNEAMLRSEPRNEHDLVIAAKNGWVCGFDNVSSLSSWLSDAICRLATGSGFGTRKLYEDDEEMIFSACRPVLLNGIEEVITRGDLLDRALVLSLPMIADKQRRNERELDAEFEAARPAIFGALLDAVAAALKNVGNVRLDRPPRMADFATWVVAAEPALPWDSGKFLEAYADNRGNADALTLETSLLVAPLQTIVTKGFRGTATELLARLDGLVEDDVRRHKDWPATAQTLGGLLRRLAPALRSIGVGIEWDRDKKRRTITIGSVPLDAVTAVTAVTDGSATGDEDDRDDGSDDRTNRAAVTLEPDPNEGGDEGDGDDSDLPARSSPTLPPGGVSPSSKQREDPGGIEEADDADDVVPDDFFFFWSTPAASNGDADGLDETAVDHSRRRAICPKHNRPLLTATGLCAKCEADKQTSAIFGSSPTRTSR